MLWEATLTAETALKHQCRQYLRMRGWFTFHLLQGLGCYPGLSDLAAVKNGRVLWIETKAPGSAGQKQIPGMGKKCAKGRQSEKQAAFERDIREHGGEYLLVWSVDDLIRAGV